METLDRTRLGKTDTHPPMSDVMIRHPASLLLAASLQNAHILSPGPKENVRQALQSNVCFAVFLWTVLARETGWEVLLAGFLDDHEQEKPHPEIAEEKQQSSPPSPSAT